jgi:hypothetical protein
MKRTPHVLLAAIFLVAAYAVPMRAAAQSPNETAAQRDQRLADRMEADRLKQEARAAPPVIPPQRKPEDDAAQRTPAPHKPEVFVAREPAKPKAKAEKKKKDKKAEKPAADKPAKKKKKKA